MLSAVRGLAIERAGKMIKPGEAVVIDGLPHRVGKITQGKRGKGGGYVRAVLKNLINGQVFEKTFTSDESVESADLEKEVCQYTWNDGHTYCFLKSESFEEVQVERSAVDSPQFFIEGQEVKLLKFNAKIIGVELPKICEYEVLQIDQQKTSSGQVSARLNCGAEVFVPMFITEGMKIRVNVVEGLYVERAH
jgi:elongation factor P